MGWSADRNRPTIWTSGNWKNAYVRGGYLGMDSEERNNTGDIEHWYHICGCDIERGGRCTDDKARHTGSQDKYNLEYRPAQFKNA